MQPVSGKGSVSLHFICYCCNSASISWELAPPLALGCIEAGALLLVQNSPAIALLADELLQYLLLVQNSPAIGDELLQYLVPAGAGQFIIPSIARGTAGAH